MLTSVYRRGLLLVYSCMVFGDTSESIDEVMSPRFFIVYTELSDLLTKTNITYKTCTHYEQKTFIPNSVCRDVGIGHFVLIMQQR